MRSSLAIILALIGVLVSPVPSAFADAPELISYQGLLSLPGGVVVPDGTYTLTFKILEEPEPQEGEPVRFVQQFAGLQITNGLYNVVLSSQPSHDLGDAFDGPTRFMELTIDAAPVEAQLTTPLVLLPRQRIASVPYALGAGTTTPTIFHTAIDQQESTAEDAISQGSWTKLTGVGPNPLSAGVTIPAEGTWVLKAHASLQIRSTDTSINSRVTARLLRAQDGGADVVRWAARVEVGTTSGEPTHAALTLMDADDVSVQNGSIYTYTIDAQRDGGTVIFNGLPGFPGFAPTSYLRVWAERVAP